MDQAEAEARMREVQRIMERTTLYTLLPGMAAVLGGLLVLVGCAVSYAMIRSLDFKALVYRPLEEQWAFCIMWTVIGAAGFALEVVLTARAAKRQGISPTARPARFAAFSLTPGILTAMVLTVKLLMDSLRTAELIQYVVPSWMMCYGAGVYTAGLFSIRLPRLLGMAFILAGAVALLCFPQYGVVSAALSFGLFHIVFGLIVVSRSRRSAAT
jgi:hypothetical protein